jgi:hypothetical protein
MTTGVASGSPQLLFGKGVPTLIAPEDSRYFDTTTANAYIEYISKGGVWKGVNGGQGSIATGLFSALPSAAAANEGYRGFITDGNNATFNQVAGGSGTFIVPVFSDGTNWRVG